jgi:6-phosphogluconolactonase
MSEPPSIHGLYDLEAASRAAADLFASSVSEAIEQRSQAYVALSGGSTPIRLYRVLASGGYIADPVDWPRVHVFWSDERCVPPDSPGSNYRLAYDELLSKVPVAADNVHRIRGEIDPADAAQEYEQIVRATVPAGSGGVPRFDLLLLGLGDDGHTASVFPGSPLLGSPDERLVAAVYVPKLKAHRLTFTPRLLNAAREVLFLVAGAGKAEALAAVLEGDADPAQYPASIVQPDDGHVTWAVDRDAASGLRQSS